MMLYKYFPPERIDILHNLKIRLSQPAIYNDPFELSPLSYSMITEEQFNNIMPVLLQYHGGPEDEIIKISKITYADFIADHSYVLSLIKEVVTCGSLALCLTDVPNNLLMWAHYASCHNGFVIGFDTKHEFFTCPKGSYSLKRIAYQVQRPLVFFPYPDPSALYFTKSLEWEYEKEWRLFRRPLDYYKSGTDGYGFPIYLFDLPSEAIKEIILGCRMSLCMRETLSAFVRKEYPNVRIKSAMLSNAKFELIISEDIEK